jgi:hypothetical protein
VGERLVGLFAQPRDDRYAAEAEDQERIMGVADDAGQFLLEDLVQDRERLLLGILVHRGPPAANRVRSGRAAGILSSARP